MTAAGWVVMILAIGGMSSLLCWCVWKVISTPGATEHVHGQSNIEPDDLDQE